MQVRIDLISKAQLESEVGKGVEGAFGIPKNPNKPPRIFIAKELPKNQKDIALSHELIHYKTSRSILNSPLEKLPYEIRPSELLAFGLENRFAKKGFREEIPLSLILEKSPLKSGKTTKVDLPPISPLKRGGFEVTKKPKEFIFRERIQ